jgi:SET domain-containing protein
MSNKNQNGDLFPLILAASKIHGVGVFATRRIKPGERLPLFSREKIPLVPLESIPRVFRRYCVAEGKKKAWCPANFGRMSIGWYLNHSKRPNVRHKKNRFSAAREIKSGEELTIDYRTLNPSE